MTMSAVFASAWNISRPRGDLRFRVTLFLFRFIKQKNTESTPGFSVNPNRPGSPVGGSILMTSAPSHASVSAQPGPASYCERSSTRSPSRAVPIVRLLCGSQVSCAYHGQGYLSSSGSWCSAPTARSGRARPAGRRDVEGRVPLEEPRRALSTSRDSRCYGSRMPGATNAEDPGVRALEKRFAGRVIRAGDADYDEARAVWNRMIDRRPALIARCASTDDVVLALRFGRDHDLPISVRGGGHNVTGNAVVDGGLMIDLSAMKAARVDPARRVIVDGPRAHLEGLRPRDAAVRSGDDGRHRLVDGRGRVDARRRPRLADAAPRAHLRQPPVGPARHRRRPARDRERGREPRSLLGRPRRRRQLRDRDVLRVPAASGHDGPGGVRPLSAHAGPRGLPRLPRVRRRGARRADRRRAHHDLVRRHARDRRRRLSLRRPRGRRAARAAGATSRRAARGHDPPHELRRAPDDVRRDESARPLVLPHRLPHGREGARRRLRRPRCSRRRTSRHRRRCRASSSSTSAARWRACPPTPRRSCIARPPST